MKRCVLAFVILGSACGLLCPGCGSAHRDPQTGVEANYAWETLRAELDLEIREVYPAAHGAADEMDLKVMRSHVNGIAAEVFALDSHLETVDIRMEAMPEFRTLLTIRIGLFGNRNKSIVLFDRIMGNLAQRGEFARIGPSQRPEGTRADRRW